MSTQTLQNKFDNLVTQATVRDESSLAEPDWTTNLAIVDAVNKSPRPLAKVLALTIEKHLKKQKTNPKTILLTLTLLETCIKNCGPEFQEAISDPSFVQRLLKTGGSRISKPKSALKKTFTSAKELSQSRVEEKVCALIQWMGPLHPSKLPIYNQSYENLNRKGVQFPEPKPEDHAPWSTEERENRLRQSREAVRIPPEMKPELEEIKQTSTLLYGMIAAAKSAQELEGEVLVELAQRLKSSQPKLDLWVKETTKTRNEPLTEVLIRVSEKIHETLEKYETKKRGEKPPSPEQAPKKTDEDLIDFNDIFEQPASTTNPSNSDWNPFADVTNNNNSPHQVQTNFDWFTNMPTPTNTQPQQSNPFMNWLNQ